ncbi:hypothetical protein [Rhizobium lusitanum]|uniref:CHRD domain-containing protein n=1 Tax=Rhizobium lusitanum TaxID=293958 RepID=A0A1C3VS16_9HYPH|nr:hypothetical protein [Rhizobium lusitanum]SCB30407.1 hypothetical protein GA0061101_106105 [Rhizobium lusitanum]
MKFRTFGIAVAAALSLFGTTHAADPGFAYDRFSSVVIHGFDSDVQMEVSLGVSDGGKETALTITSRSRPVATIDMDGTIHSDGADPKLLMKAIYMLSRNIQGFGPIDLDQHLSQKMPDLDDLR